MPLFKDSRDFEYISDVYVYTEQFGKKGHQMGRKVGDMLEILTMGYCLSNNELKNCMKTEMALEGFTGAKHKVEFSFFKLDKNNKFFLNKEGIIDQNNLIGFIECKKVGVEVTVHSETRDGDLILKEGASHSYRISPRWLKREINFEIKCLKVDKDKVELNIISDNSKEQSNNTQANNKIKEIIQIPLNRRFLITLVENGTLRIIRSDQKLYDISEKVRLCHVFTLTKITDQAHFKIEVCLTGPQTIEKAKQSALVALDVRKKLIGKWGKEEKTNVDNFTSILVIGDVSHWENKSRKVVTKTIDYNLVVPDYIIVDAFKRFHTKFGDDFLKYISKDKLKTDKEVQKLINEILLEYEYAFFYGLDDFKFKKIEKIKDSLIVSDL